MIIGIPRERKTLEKRVALTPNGAKELVGCGHRVIIEKNAGAGAFFKDNEYLRAGCKLVDTLGEVWQQSELIVKVKEPAPEEYPFFSPSKAIFSYLHLAGIPMAAKALVNGGMTAIAYEVVEPSPGLFTLLRPMSEIAGKLSVVNGGYFLLSQHGGRGKLLGGTKNADSSVVTIIGAGVAGTEACLIAERLGAKVTVMDINMEELDILRERCQSNTELLILSSEALVKKISSTDLLITAVLVPGGKTPYVVTDKMLKKLPKGAVVVDISIDQGGAVEGIRATSLKKPVYKKGGNLFYAVPNMPSQTARTSTDALTSVTLPYILKLAQLGIENALLKCDELGKACCVANGRITNETIASVLKNDN